MQVFCALSETRMWKTSSHLNTFTKPMTLKTLPLPWRSCGSTFAGRSTCSFERLRHRNYGTTIGDPVLWPHLCQVPFPEVERNKVSVLIGTNVQEAFIPLEEKKGEPNEPFAIRSRLGWSILGGSVKCSKKNEFNLNHFSCEEISLSHQVEDIWRVESYPTEKLSPKSMSIEDRKAMKIIETTMSKVDDHYQMGLLWKMDDPSLPFNRASGEIRLQHLKTRSSRDPNLKSKYRAVFNEYVNMGYARKLKPDEAARKTRIAWYLQHHPVFNVNKPKKCSVLFDAAARFNDGM